VVIPWLNLGRLEHERDLRGVMHGGHRGGVGRTLASLDNDGLIFLPWQRHNLVVSLWHWLWGNPGSLCCRLRRTGSGGLALAPTGLAAGAEKLTVVRAGKTRMRFFLVIMHSLHVVVQVVATRKAVAGKATLTSRIEAKVRAVSVSMHAVGLALMTEQAGSGGELLLGTSFDLTSEGFEVRVDEFAIGTFGQYG